MTRSEHLTDDELLTLVGRPARPEALEPVPGVEAHLASCVECAGRLTVVRDVWDGLGAGAQSPPSSRMWSAIDSAVHSAEARTPGAPSSGARTPKGWAWAAVFVLALGLGGVWQVYLRPSAVPQVSGLSASATSARLAAIGELEASVDHPAVRSALLALLRDDPSEHVRLFALDALRGSFETGELERDTLLDVLGAERSPLVQTDLIVLFRSLGGGDIPTDLGSGSRGPLHPFVSTQLTSS